MNKIVDKLPSAKLILVPKGDDNQPCLQAFEEATGLKVPAFGNRQLEASAGGLTYIKVKGRDIPRLIAAGYGDIGLTGSDSCEEYMAADNSISYESFGTQMCRFVLLAPKTKAATVRKQLQTQGGSISVATSFPELLNKCALKAGIKLLASEIVVSGSVEIMPRLCGISLVADLVSSGATAKANGLVEIENLLDVYPAFVIKNGGQR